MRILLIKTHRLGDVLQTFPLLRGLRQRWPTAEIEYLVHARYAVMLEGNPDVSRVLAWKQKTGDPVALPGPGVEEFEGDEAMIRRLTVAPYDQVINLNPDAYTSTLALALPARSRIGCFQTAAGLLRTGPLALWQTSAVYFRPLSILNIADSFLWNAGIAPSLDCVVPARETPEPIFRRLSLDPSVPTVAIQPGSADAYRRWPPERYAEVARQLRERGYQVAVLGSTAEADLAAAICGPSGACFAAGLDLRELRGFLHGCSLLLTNDTGPMHLAASLGRPVLALYFGPSIPQDTGAYLPGTRTLVARLPCLPCEVPARCSIDLACRQQLSAQAVMDLLDNQPPSPGLQSYTAEHTAGGLYQRPHAPLSEDEWTRAWLARAWLRVFGPALPLVPGQISEPHQKVVTTLARGEAPPEVQGPLGIAARLAKVLPALLRICPEERRTAAELLRAWARELASGP